MMKKRIFSMLLVVCMVFTLVPTTAFAAEDNIPVGTSNTGDNVTIDSGTPAVCPHEHDDTCGYIEAVEGSPCTHLNEDGSYSCAPLVSGNEAAPSDAAYVCNHSDSCGFIEAVAGSPCTHACELCSTQAVPPVGEDSILPPAEDCDCTVQCTAADEANEIETAIKSDCPVCGAEGADLTQCKGEAPALLEAPRASDTVYENLGATGNEANITATLSGTTLAITGSGAMKDWESGTEVPWYTNRGTITTVTIADGITNIGNDAFNGCTALASITIPASVTAIGDRAFYNCMALTSVTFAEGSELTTIGTSAFNNCTALKSIAIPENVTTIGTFAFNNCTALKSITIPESVTAIGEQAFTDCLALTSVTFAEGSELTTIDSGAFSGCTVLKSITIPESVTAIGEQAFNYCTALTSITFKGAIAPILGGNNVFTNTHINLKIYIPEGATDYTGGTASTEWKALASKIEVPAETSWNIGAGSDATTVKATLSADGTTLAITGSGAMFDWPDETVPWDSVKGTIETVTIAEGITNIGRNAFGGCNALKTVTFAEESQLKTIGDSAFYYCTALISITIPEGVTTIREDAFYDCSALTSIIIPDGVTTIVDSTFNGCTALKTVTFAEESQLKTIGDSAFGNCGALTSIIIPDGVTTILDNTFNGCDALKTVTFAKGSQLETIGTSAFNGCTALESITIPDGVTTLGNKTFYFCPVLESVTFKRTTAPTLGTNVFDNTHADLKIYIPAGASGYTGDTASANWKELASKIVPPVTSVTVSPSTATVQKGTTQQFSAVVAGAGSPAQTVTWAVEGGIAGTSINSSGLLTVAAGETATPLTIKATSTMDTSKSGTATVAVTSVPVTNTNH